ncbi:MAG: DUF1385 domain-containing protein [Candidatus Krumholzibacteria bacterium]|jgi:uncharacterized protein YqhQ|nr:DUF1385 domain-containing protein [Candidatus Krumholzibacteria bacterium]MDP6668805.1 DUF1385 domain-containing protein [Candidatus Krumholzibacteria bacterium]MDP6796931.1 DUF1385 domain-containing protein [Candidatus Krumholzibacteria bacterium]MDP7022326.1 DUF1385 domain-containing protein [Candidatus Krumholzibacteria bacterium]
MSRESYAVGGQAVIEGVMMRAKDYIACAVRSPEGEVVLKKEPFRSFLVRFRLHKIPILRGGIGLIESMIVGMRMLTYSAEVAMPEEEKKEGRAWLDRLWMILTLIFAFVAGLGLFFYIPLILTDLVPGTESSLAFNLVDGLFRLLIFLAYIWVISLWKDMRRVFQYHGAEHKTINAFEAGEKLSPEVIQSYSRLHPRCGTSFLLLVMLVSILVFLFLGRPETIGDRLIRLAFIPLIGGISYELIKLSAKGSWKYWLAPLVYPGLGLQLMTTKEPDLDQCEVALCSLAACLPPDELEEKIAEEWIPADGEMEKGEE